jgi:hypothetical protein
MDEVTWLGSISQIALLAPIFVVPMCLRKRKPWFWASVLCGTLAFSFQWARMAAGGHAHGQEWGTLFFLLFPIAAGWIYAHFCQAYFE